MCVETLNTGLVFLRQLIWGVTCLGLLKNECFPIYLLWNTINVCWNHQNRARFSETIHLRGHMPQFTWKMHVFPSISLETSEMCVETIRIELVFLRGLIWGVTCLGLLENECFPIYLLRSARNVCCNHQNRARFYETIILRGHMPRFTRKWTFSHLSP